MNNITNLNSKFAELNYLGDYGEAGFNVYTKQLKYDCTK